MRCCRIRNAWRARLVCPSRATKRPRSRFTRHRRLRRAHLRYQRARRRCHRRRCRTLYPRRRRRPTHRRPPPPTPAPPTAPTTRARPLRAPAGARSAAEYHFYLYDETPDGVDLKLWEWPRLTPQDAQLANNGICTLLATHSNHQALATHAQPCAVFRDAGEDGLPAVNTSIPQGDYYVAFGSPDCAVHHVNLSTALISGCGRIDLVPCLRGTDCADCGRSASAMAAAAATQRRRRRRGGAARARRRARAAAPVDGAQDGHELPFARAVAPGHADHAPLERGRAARTRVTPCWELSLFYSRRIKKCPRVPP